MKLMFDADEGWAVLVIDDSRKPRGAGELCVDAYVLTGPMSGFVHRIPRRLLTDKILGLGLPADEYEAIRELHRRAAEDAAEDAAAANAGRGITS